ncbi:hypothetical protein Bbelb_232360 [Branchiostoma belcheri]|nr:hypothetical protein Bbelb_232360 [Branchiostoma belcheri]
MAHSEEELREWQERYEIRKKTLKKAQTSGTYGYSFGETLAEEFSKAKDKAKLLSTTVQYARLLVEPEGTSVMFPERGREYTWTLEVQPISQTQLQLKKLAFMEGSCSQFKIKAVTSPSKQPLDGLLSEDGQEWISHDVQQSISKGFIVQITFCSNQYGSFNQAVVFDLGQRPFLVCPLHVDVAMETDLNYLTELRDKFMLLGTSWEDQGKVVQFLDEAVPDQDDEGELGGKYQLTPKSENLITLKIFKEEMLTKPNYKQRQHQLLFIEEAEQSEHIRRLTLQTVGVVSNMLEKVFTDSTCVEFAHSGECFIHINLNEALSEDTPQGYLLTRSLSPKAQIIIHTACVDQDAYEVWVEWTTKDSIWLRIPSSVCQHFGLEQDTEVKMEVQFKLNRKPMLLRHCAVDAIKDIKMVFPDDPNYSKRFWKNLRKECPTPPRTLNDKQREAFAKITAPTEKLIPPLLLIGPFGTGKTHTIAAAASAVAREDDSRILICTHTNDAADLYIRNYLKTEDIPGSRTLRIYYKNRKKTTVPEDVLRHCVMSEDGTTFRYPTEEEVRAAKIVITTLSLSLVLEREVGLKPGFFTHIMVDEAAQALECEAIMPLSLATAETRVVLTGDHMQVFYGGKLICRSETKKHPDFSPLAFYTAYGEDSEESATTSFYNDAEVWEVADRVEALWNSWPEAEWGERDDNSMAQIGVVTPYQDQVNRIRLALRGKGLAGVTVETVTNVQGKEYQALFLSTVRTRATCCGEQLNSPHVQETQEEKTHNFGFLSDPKLLNTAITRAKSFVGVVGDPLSLCSVGSCSKIWLEYIDHCSKHKGLEGTSIEEIKHYLNSLEMEASSLPVASVLRPEAPVFVPQKRGIRQPTSEAQGSHASQQKETRNQAMLPPPSGRQSGSFSPMKDYKPTFSTSKSPGSTTAISPLSFSADGVMRSHMGHLQKGLKAREDFLPHHTEDAVRHGMANLTIQPTGRLKTDDISSALQRQVSKAESTAEDDVDNSSSSDSDEMLHTHTQGGQTQVVIESKTTPYHAETTCSPEFSPATTKQKEDTGAQQIEPSPMTMTTL